jgi:Tfp pilus assembly protein FimT
MKQKYMAFSLLEAILIAAFIGIFAIIAIPRFNYAVVSKQKAEGTAKKIVTDLRLTRSLAISDAVNNDKGFELNMLGSDPYTGYEIENRDTNEIISTHAFDDDVICNGSNKFRFGPLGNLSDTGHVQLTVSADGKTFTIIITSATGAVKCTQN